jgi:mRNA degradation ribonuclease J1/J2
MGLGPSGVNGYLLRCTRTEEQLLVDAADDVLFVAAIMGSRGLSTIVTTHAHEAHVRALAELEESTFARTVAHPEDGDALPTPTSHPVRDGDVVEVGEEVRHVDRIQAGMTFVDGLGIGDVGGEVLRDRRKLSADGVVVVVIIVDSQTGELVGGPDVVNRGFVHEETSAYILDEGRERVIQAVKESAGAHVTDPSALQQNVRRALARYFNEVTQRKPVILPVIMEV